MKNTCFCARIAGLSRYLSGVCILGLTASLPAAAITSGYASSAATDVAAGDSVALYPEEQQRRDLVKNSKVIFINGDEGERASRDSVERLIARFYVDQFRNSQDPEAPYFTFMSKGADVAMGVGAVIKMRGYFDWNGSIDGASFNPYLINMPKTPENMKGLGASVAGTTIYFSIVGRHSVIGDYRGYIEGGFNGYQNSGFKLKKAWFQVRDFTAGLATTTFSDPAAQPDLLDGAGANGKVDKSNVLVRYLHTFANRWSVAASVEFPSSNQDHADPALTKKVKDYVPDFAALGQYQWNRGLSHVRLAGLLRTMSYHDEVTGRNRHVTGWGVMLGTVVRAGRYLTFFGQGSVGQGMSSYTCDLSIGNYDLLADPGHAGELYSPTTASGTVGVKGYWLPNLTSTIALATLRTYARDGVAGDKYKYGQYLAVNLIWDITPRLQAGVEYETGKRMNYSGAHVNANRAQVVFTASF